MQTSSRKLTLKVCVLVALAVGGLVTYGLVSSRLLFRWLALPMCFLGGHQGITHPETQYLGEVLDCVSGELSDIEGLYFAGQELSGMGEKIDFIDLKLDLVGGPIEQEQARRLIVRMQKSFLDCINEHVDSPQFFSSYPVSLHEARVTLFIRDKDGDVYAHPAVSVVSSRSGVIRYCGHATTEIRPYDHRETESWEEAVRIVEGAPDAYSN